MSLVLTRRPSPVGMARPPTQATATYPLDTAYGQDFLTLKAKGPDALFDDAALCDLPQTAITTTTFWTDWETHFSGPSLYALLAAAGLAEGITAVRLIALSDHMMVMNDAVIDPVAPIVANRMNGAPIAVRDQGPLWVICPFNRRSQCSAKSHFALTIRQLSRIEVS